MLERPCDLKEGGAHPGHLLSPSATPRHCFRRPRLQCPSLRIPPTDSSPVPLKTWWPPQEQGGHRQHPSGPRYLQPFIATDPTRHPQVHGDVQ